ncbi:MAG: hypothetical protein JNK82_44175, partial [Myxococcaceae bacterium]|nr:hypothetical protein [Myxococcaceae bacterium]
MTEAVTAPSGQTRACKGCGEPFSADLTSCPKCSMPWADEPPTGPAPAVE